MKLGKDTGSLMNYIVGTSKDPKPEAGMGATLLMWTDRRAYTIHEVKGKKLWASSDVATRVDKNGMSEDQVYEYKNENQNNPDNWTLFTLRKDGKWHKGTTLGGSVLAIGYRREYYDYSF